MTFPLMGNILSLLVNRPRVVTPVVPSNSNDKTITDFTTSVARILTASAENVEQMTTLCSPPALQHLLDHYRDNLDLASLPPDRAAHIREKLQSVLAYVAR